MPTLTVPSVTATGSVPAPTVVNPSPQTVAPGSVTATGTVPGPTVSVGPAPPPPQTVSPPSVMGSATVPGPDVSFSSLPQTVGPPSVLGTGLVGVPSLTGGALGIAPFSVIGTGHIGVPGVATSEFRTITETTYTWRVNKRARALRFRLTTSGPSARAKLRSVEVNHRDLGRE